MSVYVYSWYLSIFDKGSSHSKTVSGWTSLAIMSADDFAQISANSKAELRRTGWMVEWFVGFPYLPGFVYCKFFASYVPTIWRDLKNSYHESYTKGWNYFWCSDFTSSLWGGTQLNQVLPHVGARKSARLALAFCDICMFNVQFCAFLHANGQNMNINVE